VANISDLQPIKAMERHKYVEWGLGLAALFVALLALRSRNASKAIPLQQQAAPMPIPQSPQAQPSGTGGDIANAMQSVIASVTQTQQGIAALSANQGTELGISETILGAQSWLSCCNPFNWNCEATCLKSKGGVTVPGGMNVSNIKTRNKGAFMAAASPFAQCLRGQGYYDFQCVGGLIAGSPTYNSISVSTGVNNPVTRVPIRPQNHPASPHTLGWH
jgi:hypothetical protein